MPRLTASASMDALQETDDRAYQEEYDAAMAVAAAAFAQQDIPGDVDLAWQEFLRVQPWTRDGDCVQRPVKTHLGTKWMKKQHWNAAVAEFEGGWKSSGASEDIKVPLPQPRDVDYPYRNLETYDDQTSYKVPKLQGMVQPLKHESSESQYVPIDMVSPKRLDDVGKDSKRDVSKAISWAGTTPSIEIGRECFARCEAIRQAASRASIQQTGIEGMPAPPPMVSKKRKLSDSACQPISGNAVKKAKKESAAV